MSPSDSPDRDLPPLPHDSPGQPSAPSVHTVSTSSRTNTDARSTRTRERSRRDSKDSPVYDEVARTLRKLQSQLLDEKRRGDDAERKLKEITAHLKTVNDARLLAMQDAARAKEELKLYKIQLEAAQREIYRAQDVIEIVDRQRASAEKEAAKSRTKARQLNETLAVQAAREEAWRLGLQEGLDRGRNIPFSDDPQARYSGGREDVFEEEDEYSSEESRSAYPETNQHASRSRPLSVAASNRSKAPSVTQTRASPPPLPSNPPTAPPSAPPSLHPSEQIRPRSIRNASPTPRMSHAYVPPDNLIPSLDADNRIRIPPPFEFSRTPDRPSSPQLPTLSDSSQEPLPIPLRGNTPQQRKRYHHRRNSSSGSNSSSLSHLDIVNDPFGGALRTPMSIIPEVLSVYSGSPYPQSFDGDRSMRHQRSMSENSVQQGNNYEPSIRQRPVDTQSQHRPNSRSSFAPPSQTQRNSHISGSSTPPDINIQPPSLPVSSKTESLRGGSHAGGSPAASYRAPLPSLSEMHDNQPRYASSSSQSMPGGYANMRASATPASTSNAIPSSSRQRHHSSQRDGYTNYPNADDDAVSSAMSADTLTTPPAKYRSAEGDWSGAISMAGQVPIQPASVTSHPGSVNTAAWSLPEPAIGVNMNGKTKGKSSKGRRR